MLNSMLLVKPKLCDTKINSNPLKTEFFIDFSRLAAIFSLPIFYHKFYVFSSKIAIYKYSDIAFVGHINPYNELYKYQVGLKDTPGG